MQFGLDSRLQPTLKIKDCLGSFNVTYSLGEVQQIEIPRPGLFLVQGHQDVFAYYACNPRGSIMHSGYDGGRAMTSSQFLGEILADFVANDLRVAHSTGILRSLRLHSCSEWSHLNTLLSLKLLSPTALLAATCPFRPGLGVFGCFLELGEKNAWLSPWKMIHLIPFGMIWGYQGTLW